MLWTTEILLEPIIKGFKFHFEGSKATNKIEKPEWYLSHINSLITSHNDFILYKLQPILNSLEIYHFDIKQEFIKGLLKTIVNKLENQIPLLLENSNLFYHTINELLSFQKNLKINHNYSNDNSIQSLQPFYNSQLSLNKWIKLENQCNFFYFFYFFLFLK
jgi:hypothetical protein